MDKVIDQEIHQIEYTASMQIIFNDVEYSVCLDIIDDLNTGHELITINSILDNSTNEELKKSSKNYIPTYLYIKKEATIFQNKEKVL